MGYRSPRHAPPAQRGPGGRWPPRAPLTAHRPMAAPYANTAARTERGSAGAVARARLERGSGRREGAGAGRPPPCCGPCGGGGTPTSTASCPGWPSTSAASAGEARGRSRAPAGSGEAGVGRPVSPPFLPSGGVRWRPAAPPGAGFFGLEELPELGESSLPSGGGGARSRRRGPAPPSRELTRVFPWEAAALREGFSLVCRFAGAKL